MAITKREPNRVLLTPTDPSRLVDDGDFVASAALTPGHLVELHDSGGATKLRKNASATEIQAAIVALEDTLNNKKITDAYAAGDQVPHYYLQGGDVFYGLVASGQTVTHAALYQSAGDGTLKAATASTEDAGLGRFMSLDDDGAVVAATRVRFRVIR